MSDVLCWITSQEPIFALTGHDFAGLLPQLLSSLGRLAGTSPIFIFK